MKERPVVFLIGVAHVFNMKDIVREEILSIAPRAICVELDNARLYALRHPEQISTKGLPFYLRVLSRIQKRLGESYGVRAGEEMLTAVDSAKDIGARVFLVDDDAYLALRRMFKEMSIREKLRFFSALIPFPWRRGSVEKEMKKYEEDESSYIEEFSRYFPTAKRILIDERNEHMAERIYRVAVGYGRIAAVLGDAHLEGIAEILRKKGCEVQTIHLKDLKDRGVRVEIRYSTSIK